MLGYFRALRRLDRLEDDFRRLKVDQEAAMLDLEMLYEKTRRLFGRISKRAALAEETEAERLPQPDGSHAEFLAKLDPTSRRIWERRLKPAFPKE